MALPYSQIVNLPTFSGVDDGYMYLHWEAKVDHTFHVYKVQDDQKLRIVSLYFLDYAKEWWHQTLRHIGYNKRPPVVSWNDLKSVCR